MIVMGVYKFSCASYFGDGRHKILRLGHSKQDETHGTQVPKQDTRHHLCYAKKIGSFKW
jgi:hypothetical protein